MYIIIKTTNKFIILCACCVAALLLGVGVGSVPVTPGQTLAVLAYKIFGRQLPDGFSQTVVSILWSIRLPRVLTAFAAGAALSISGSVFQSVLGNPLASAYTLGVSSGASLGAALVMIFAIYPLGVLSLPVAGFLFGFGTVLLAVSFAAKVDKTLKGNTIILVGMVFSLFVNSLITLLNALNREYMQQVFLWQMGSFASRGYMHAAVLWCAAVGGTLFLLRYAREMDILTFGDDQSRAIGVNSARTKLVLLVAASALTGTTVAFTGTIGFVDLIAPHMVRRIFGPRHKILLPAAALFGGGFMVVMDTIARTILAPAELPVGAITALVGAPFFAWVFFRGGGRTSRKGVAK